MNIILEEVPCADVRFWIQRKGWKRHPGLDLGPGQVDPAVPPSQQCQPNPLCLREGRLGGSLLGRPDNMG